MSELLKIDNLSVRYGGSDHLAVDSVSFEIGRGEVLGIVGESGSGKTSVGLAVLGVLPGTATVTGSITFEDRELVGLKEDKFRPLRGAQLSTIMQNASTALDPCYTIGSQFVELLRTHRSISRAAARKEALSWMGRVGIPATDQHLRAYPHEFSGGMNQRVVIAMNLALSPKLIIADEPTSALDVTVQAAVLNLLRALRDESATGMLLVTHDLGVVAQLCSRVLVMKSGKVVEANTVRALFSQPQHPYTRALLDSLPGHRAAAPTSDRSLRKAHS
jgi:ABC-type dipeptide/oligopeptide/nickel transport system ATPase component